uniref:E3 ubiquitin-protein ligase TRIM65 isoform X1 n=1 Tax=Pogona vitticeps TaxID=103695 RepID=A0A6J0UKX4_9SAUR
MAFAGSQKLEEKLCCCICLEIFSTPVTMPCGHSFCEKCINSHWDKEGEEERPSGQKVYTCPECRKTFPERLKLNKTVQLDTLVDLLRAGEVPAPREEKTTPVKGKECPRHGRPLVLYCRTEKRVICSECTVKECQDHKKVLVEDERKKQEELVKETLRKTQKEAERLKEETQKMEQQISNVKDSSEKFKSGVLQKFGHLVEALKECQRKAMERIENEQARTLGQMEENWDQVHHQLDVFTQHNMKAEKLLACTDDITFLEGLHQLHPPGKLDIPPTLEFNLASSEGGVTQFLSEVSRLFQGALLTSLNPPKPDTKTVSPEPQSTVKRAGPCLPRNEIRMSLLKDHQNLTFDPSTANKYLQFSDQDRKAIHPQGSHTKTSNELQRFESWQVMCLQKFSQGSNYWEVKLSGRSAIVGLAYERITRKKQAGRSFTIGLDPLSWGLHVQGDCYVAWHDGVSKKINEPSCKFIGVLLNYEQGVLSFYGVDENMKLLHSFNSFFTEPLIPVFWLCEGAAVTLCQKPCAPVEMDGVAPDLQAAATSMEKPSNEQTILKH